MGVRDTLNQNPAITTGATAAMIVVALAYLFWTTYSNRSSPPSADAATGPALVDSGPTSVPIR